MVTFWVVTILSVGIVNCQYGPPGHIPGTPIGEIIKAVESYAGISSSPETNYGAPLVSGRGLSDTSYGAPVSYGAPTSSYGPPNAGNSRFKIIPANEFNIPQQHTNLIRYIVLKEFQIGENGSATPLQMGLGRNNGNASPEMEIMKVQMPASAEAGSGENVGGEAVGGYAGGPSGGYDDGDDDYDDEEYDDDEEEMNNNSVGDAVVPAKGVAISGSGQSTGSTEMQAFMFSDPNSNSIEAQNRQSTGGVRNRMRNGQNRIRNRLPGRRNRNKNRNRQRNRNRNRAKVAVAAAAAAVTAGSMGMGVSDGSKSEASAAAGSSSSGPQQEELQSALQTLTKYFNSQAEIMRQQMGSGTPSSTFSAPASGSSSYSNTPSGPATGPYPESGMSAAASTGASSGMGGYQNSGNPESGSGAMSDAMSISLDSPPATPAPNPASTYGPPPGSPGFKGNSGGSITDSLTNSIQTAANFKSTITSNVASGLTAGIRTVAAATSALSTGLANVGRVAGGSGSPSPVYGVPEVKSPIQTIIGLKGQALRTGLNTGRAAIGIAGTKGQLVVNQVGTVANTLTKGVAHVLNNNHDAFQNVIKHIQTIFQTNERLKNQEWQ